VKLEGVRAQVRAFSGLPATTRSAGFGQSSLPALGFGKTMFLLSLDEIFSGHGNRKAELGYSLRLVPLLEPLLYPQQRVGLCPFTVRSCRRSSSERH
jgi:hypothetical protein